VLPNAAGHGAKKHGKAKAAHPVREFEFNPTAGTGQLAPIPVETHH
jgi:hypothetical protein